MTIIQKGEPMSDTISRQAAIDAINKLVDRFEQILRDIRETNEDESVCGLCEYDGAFIGQSGDWCNECPGFDKDNCFKLSDRCRKSWMDDITLPSAQPEINCSEFPNNSDIISRQAAIDALDKRFDSIPMNQTTEILLLRKDLRDLPSAQPEQRWIPCSECEKRCSKWEHLKT